MSENDVWNDNNSIYNQELQINKQGWNEKPAGV